MYATRVQCPRKSEEGVGFPGAGVVGGSELGWVLAAGPLEEQQVLVAAEPYLQPPKLLLLVGAHTFNSSTPEAETGRALLV